MVTLHNYSLKNRTGDFKGLSTDEKPVGKFEHNIIFNGMVFEELDTGELYYYNGKNKTWEIYN